MNAKPTTTRTAAAYPVIEETATALRYTESTTGLTLGSWSTKHAEGWTVDGRNFADVVPFVENVNRLAGWN